MRSFWPDGLYLRLFWRGNNYSPSLLPRIFAIFSPTHSPQPPTYPNNPRDCKTTRSSSALFLAKRLVTLQANPAGFRQISRNALFLLFPPTVNTPFSALLRVLREVISVCHSSSSTLEGVSWLRFTAALCPPPKHWSTLGSHQCTLSSAVATLSA